MNAYVAKRKGGVEDVTVVYSLGRKEERLREGEGILRYVHTKRGCTIAHKAQLRKD